MNLNYSEILKVLAALHWISESGIGAFKARLRKLQGEGVPMGANPGKGQRVEYSLQMAFEAAIAVELLQCGMSPFEAAKIVKANRSEFYLASLLGTVGTTIEGAGEENDPVALINPEALRAYSTRAEEGDGTLGNVAFLRRRALGQVLGKRNPFDPERGEAWRWAIIDIGAVAYSVMAVMELVLDLNREELVDEVMREFVALSAEVEVFRENRLNTVFSASSEDHGRG